MKNLLRILILLIIVAAVVGTSMFLMNRNEMYDGNNEPTFSESGETLNTEDLNIESGENDEIQSGDVEISGDLNEIEEIIESGETTEIDADEVTESGEVVESGEIIESGEITSGELAA